MWRDREGDRTVDVTLGYDLNTCLLRSSDQSSLRQAPLPAGSFSMHVTPIPHSFFPSVSHSLSLPLFIFFFFSSLLLILSPSPGRSSTSHPFDPFLGASCAACCSFTLPRRASPVLYPPLCAYSHVDSPGPLVSSCLPHCRRRGCVG